MHDRCRICPRFRSYHGMPYCAARGEPAEDFDPAGASRNIVLAVNGQQAACPDGLWEHTEEAAMRFAVVEQLRERTVRVPTMPRGIKHYAAGASKLAAAALLPDTPESHRRLEVCQTSGPEGGHCEHFTGSRCRLCGCFTKYKARLESEDCPDGRW